MTKVRAMLARAALVAMSAAGSAACGHLAEDRSIDGDTPCSEYLAADPTEKERVVRELAVEQDSSQAGGAFLILNTDAICGTDPSRPLREAIPD
jgi:hypothetical protein